MQMAMMANKCHVCMAWHKQYQWEADKINCNSNLVIISLKKVKGGN